MSVLSGQASDDTQQSLKPLPVSPHRRIQLKQLNSGDCSCFNLITNEMAAGCDDNQACCNCFCPPQEKEKTPLCVGAVERLPPTSVTFVRTARFYTPWTNHGHCAEVTHNNSERKGENFFFLNKACEVVQDGVVLIIATMLLHWQWAEGPRCVY